MIELDVLPRLRGRGRRDVKLPAVGDRGHFAQVEQHVQHRWARRILDQVLEMLHDLPEFSLPDTPGYNQSTRLVDFMSNPKDFF